MAEFVGNLRLYGRANVRKGRPRLKLFRETWRRRWRVSNAARGDGWAKGLENPTACARTHLRKYITHARYTPPTRQCVCVCYSRRRAGPGRLWGTNLGEKIDRGCPVKLLRSSDGRTVGWWRAGRDGTVGEAHEVDLQPMQGCRERSVALPPKSHRRRLVGCSSRRRRNPPDDPRF